MHIALYKMSLILKTSRDLASTLSILTAVRMAQIK